MKTRLTDLETNGVKVAVLNKEDAADLDLDALDRISLEKAGGRSVTAIVDLTSTFVKPGEIGLFRETSKALKVAEGEKLSLQPKDKPDSILYIKNKLDGKNLSPQQINAIIEDLMNEELTDVELTAWVTGTYIRGMDDKEVTALTEAIVKSGSTLSLSSERVFDKHCIGGVAGNRTTMLLVPIVAAAGLTIPKTSSRAITSPAGTADCMEVIAPVSLKKEELETIVDRVGACIAWGGAVNLAAADDKLIKVRHPLRLDPQGMLLASILAKKKAVGATDVIIDIPIGDGTKVLNKKIAVSLAKKFDDIGGKLGMTVHSLITDGDHPIGMAIGPAIEAREILKILSGDAVSQELKEKACELAGVLLELGGKAERGNGKVVAMDLIANGKAEKKFREIIEAQGGDAKVKPDDIEIGSYTHTVTSPTKGKIDQLNNRAISAVVRAAGAPQDKEAGMYLHVEEGTKVKKGDKLFTLYARSERKIDQALDVYKERNPVRFSKIILEEID
ncbi:MAG: AMP phosphorylase [Candidatus Diapherotrites archaeon]|nr:AMP phosphorylase [Candidatus Diapherotrites archaeon]